MDISSWWEALSSLEKIYFGIALPFTLFFILQTIMTFVGGDTDVDTGGSGDVDVDMDADDGIHFQFISLKNFIAFFTMFAWGGLAALRMGASQGLSIAIGVGLGLALMLIMSTIFYYMGKLQDSGTLDMNNAIGVEGSVYLTIPAAKGGYGKVQLTVQGSLRELRALTEADEELPTGTIVKVDKIINGQILAVTKA